MQHVRPWSYDDPNLPPELVFSGCGVEKRTTTLVNKAKRGIIFRCYFILTVPFMIFGLYRRFSSSFGGHAFRKKCQDSQHNVSLFILRKQTGLQRLKICRFEAIVVNLRRFLGSEMRSNNNTPYYVMKE